MGSLWESGVDKLHGLSYNLYVAKNNSWDNKYQIASVMEYQNVNLIQQCYINTTDRSLSGEQMRRLVYQRWLRQIENNVFKSLNGNMHRKRCWTHQPKTYLNLC